MHFWIDKRSQGCGFNVRRQAPLSFSSGYGRSQRGLCGSSFYPKPMVTPVHRFQSIESVANNGIRHSRGSSYHSTRGSSHCPTSIHYNGSSSNIRLPQSSRSADLSTATPPVHSPTSRRNVSSTSKLGVKCGVWMFFALITFFLVGAKYYFQGINVGAEALVFCSLLVVVLMIGGLISLCEAIMSYSPANSPVENPSVLQAPISEPEDQHAHVAPTLSQSSVVEMPPPPYHIAIMLSPSNNLDDHHHAAVQVIRDSPPPSYEKAVT